MSVAAASCSSASSRSTWASAAAPVSASMRRTPDANGAFRDDLEEADIAGARAHACRRRARPRNAARGRGRPCPRPSRRRGPRRRISRRTAPARPASTAFAGVIRRVVTSPFSRMRSLTSPSTRDDVVVRQRARLAEIEAHAVGRDQRALLRDMLAEPAAQRLMQQMRHRMIGAQLPCAASSSMRSSTASPTFSAPCVELAEMHEEIAGFFCVSRHRELAAGRGEHRAGIAHLAAGFAVERRLVDDDRGLACRPRLRSTCLPSTTMACDHALGDMRVVAEEFGGAEFFAQLEPELARSPPRRSRPSSSRASARCCAIAASKPAVATLRSRPRSTSWVRSSGKP